MVQPSWKTVWLFLNIKCTLTIWPNNPTPRWVNFASNFATTLVGEKNLSWLSYLQFHTILTSTRGCFSNSPGVALPWAPLLVKAVTWTHLHSQCTGHYSLQIYFLETLTGFVTLCSSHVYQFCLPSSSTWSPCFFLSSLFAASRYLSTHRLKRCLSDPNCISSPNHLLRINSYSFSCLEDHSICLKPYPPYKQNETSKYSNTKIKQGGKICFLL